MIFNDPDLNLRAEYSLFELGGQCVSAMVKPASG